MNSKHQKYEDRLMEMFQVYLELVIGGKQKLRSIN